MFPIEMNLENSLQELVSVGTFQPCFHRARVDGSATGQTWNAANKTQCVLDPGL